MNDTLIALAISMLLNIIFIATIMYMIFGIFLNENKKIKKEIKEVKK